MESFEDFVLKIVYTVAYMKILSTRGQRHSLSFTQGISYFEILKIFESYSANCNQMSFGASRVEGNTKFLNSSREHEQYGCLAYIWLNR